MNSIGTESRTVPRQQASRESRRICTAGRNRDRRRGGGEQPERDSRQPGGEHVVHPQAEAEKARADRGEDDPRVAHHRAPRKRRHDHRHERHRGKKDNIDLWMAEDPEKMLPQQRVAASRRIEERPMKIALNLHQQVAGNERRKREEHHRRRHEHVPAIKRDEVDAHARRTTLEHADYKLYRRRDSGHFDEAEAKQPEVGANIRVDTRWLAADT